MIPVPSAGPEVFLVPQNPVQIAPRLPLPTGPASDTSSGGMTPTTPISFAGSGTDTTGGTSDSGSTEPGPGTTTTSPLSGATTTIPVNANTTNNPSALADILANLGNILGSSASGGSGAASNGATTAVPVDPASQTQQSTPMTKLLLAAVVVGAAWYGYKHGWLAKLGIGAIAGG